MAAARKKLIEVAIPLEAISDLVREARAEIERDALAASCPDDSIPLRDGGAGAKAYADAARDLAYCLYDICTNKRRDAGEAAYYNGLITVWPELTRQAAAIHDTRGNRQVGLEEL